MLFWGPMLEMARWVELIVVAALVVEISGTRQRPVLAVLGGETTGSMYHRGPLELGVIAGQLARDLEKGFAVGGKRQRRGIVSSCLRLTEGFQSSIGSTSLSSRMAAIPLSVPCAAETRSYRSWPRGAPPQAISWNDILSPERDPCGPCAPLMGLGDDQFGYPTVG